MALGLTDGFVDDPLSGSGFGSSGVSSVVASATKVAMGAAKSLVSGQDPGPDLSMMSDEFI